MIKNILDEIVLFDKRIQYFFTRFNIDDLFCLPNIKLESPQDLKDIPTNIAGVYFLLHKKYDLLYVGKSRDLRQRWRRSLSWPGTVSEQHHMFLKAIELGEVKLSWLELNSDLSTLFEFHIIKNMNPLWNTLGISKKQNIKICTAKNDQIDKAMGFIGKKVKLIKDRKEYNYHDFLPEEKTFGTITNVFSFSNESMFDVCIHWDGEIYSENKNLFYIFPKPEFFNQFCFIP